jgi:hypothetical protein
VRQSLVIATMVCMLFFGLVGIAMADSTGNQGQPNQSCQSQPSAPGGQVPGSNAGSPFAVGVSDDHYAGSAPQNSSNPNSVSQYDVACFQVSQSHP